MISILLLVGCADNALSKGDAAEQGATDTGVYDSGAMDADSAEVVLADHWTLRGRVTILDGAALSDGAALDVDTVRAADGAVVCGAAYDTALLISASPPDPSLFHWWSGAVAPADACEGVPATLSVGIGPLLPDLRARLGAAGLEQAADALYGAYLSDGASTVWAFGAAGTEDAYTGAGAPADVPVDGTYTLVPLYAIALDGT